MGFTLSIPTEEDIKNELVVETAVPEALHGPINDKVDEAVNEIMKVDVLDMTSRRDILREFTNFGKDEIELVTKKNSILNQRMATFRTQTDETAMVAKGLEDLTFQMKDLDPSGIDFIKKTKLFDPVRRYFAKFKTADDHIATIIDSLDKGKRQLENDNTTLEVEEVALRNNTKSMSAQIEFGKQLDEKLQAAITQACASGADEEQVKFIEEEVLYPLRQRIEDIQQMQLVSQQGYISIEMIRRNNRELIRSVDRARTVTVTALRTAVMVAGALYNQKIVLDKVTALNSCTNQMIESVSVLLKEQGVAIQKQASETAINIETFQAAFSNMTQALDDISTYRQNALPMMRDTIDKFTAMAEEGEAVIQRMEKRSALDAKNIGKLEG